MKWLTLEYIKAHSRIDFDIDNNLLELYGNSAETSVLNICNRSYENLIDEYGEVPAPLYEASLMLVEVSYTFRNPDSQVNLWAVPYTFDFLVKPYMKLTTTTTTKTKTAASGANENEKKYGCEDFSD